MTIAQKNLLMLLATLTLDTLTGKARAADKADEIELLRVQIATVEQEDQGDDIHPDDHSAPVVNPIQVRAVLLRWVDKFMSTFPDKGTRVIMAHELGDYQMNYPQTEAVLAEVFGACCADYVKADSQTPHAA